MPSSREAPLTPPPPQIQPVTLNRSITDNTPLDPPLPPHIQPPFYGGLVVNTLVGRTGAAQIVELAVDDADVTGYAAFEHGRLARAVFVNLHAWLASSTGARPAVHIGLHLDFGNHTARGATAAARRLVIDHADDTANLTWGGLSYETADVRPVGSPAVETVVLSAGVDLRSTEAILLEF